ncbi:uroporphyrinogen-III C-methyltransferase [Mucisphaera sp.]|uniref:uroporphyrinogen-III C-methyltransferase n=1 Tax=Mucisphaera sp. TaxID=2913024 RepID=UPI003D0AE6E3
MIGSGPGDPGLITVRGLERLRQADVVIFDALADPALLKEVRADAVLIDAGKRARAHKLTQDQINETIVKHAKNGLFVVRLKGGDPYLFGRGAEEALYAQRHGLVTEIVPGVTSGLAAPAAAGIPVTHRDVASSVTLITGHETPDKPASRLDYRTLAGLARDGGTLCFYMGVGRMQAIFDALVEHGLAEETPAAVVQWGTLPRQRVARGTLATLVERAAEAGVSSPAIIVVGGVAGLDEVGLQAWSMRPLFGQRVLVTRTRAQASDLANRLAALGADVVEASTIRIVPAADVGQLDAHIRDLPSYDWLCLTSANAVDSLAEAVDRCELDARWFAGLRVAVIGRSTAGRLREVLGLRADLLPDEHHGGALAEAMVSASGASPGRAVLWRADLGGAELPSLLSSAGWQVDDLEAYRTESVSSLDEDVVAGIRQGAFDWVTLTSSSTARNLVSLLGEDADYLEGIKRASIGPLTSRTLDELGYPATVEAQEASISSVVEAMAGYRLSGDSAG